MGYMIDGIKTLDDFDFAGKTVLMRCDLNTPLDPVSGDFLEDRRMRSHLPTIQELMDKKAKVVCMAHQGKPGESEFTSLDKHAAHLGKLLGCEVKYADDLFGPTARTMIKNLGDGEVLLLDNVRMYSEEALERPPEVHSKSYLVKNLAPLADLFVNDAFGTAHRSHASTVGFTPVLPCVAGRLMEREIRALSDVTKNPKKPIVFILGGAKVKDSMKIIQKALDRGVDKILLGGVLANVFLAAKDYRLGEPTIEFIRGKKFIELIDVAKQILDKYSDQIVLPIDVALDKSGQRIEIPLSELPQDYKIVDLGKLTVQKYTNIIQSSGTVFFNGALGLYETPAFAYATEEIIKAIAVAKSFSVIGGGDTVAAARNLNVEDNITHVSTGGKASIDFLAGVKMAAIEALKGQ
ncbi:MAG: phosphoglycerate kinase [Candidatus Altiarchaeota archaeon]|nr:phosphoglycerate kinase [Candidatus Altiarchaeota archaeon]